jgi:hypothetical protein
VIRPITCICFLLACGSGLYLYQAKHRVNLIDEQIRQTVRTTDAEREQIRLLHAEWTRLSQPDRLQNLADQFLKLKTTSPSQFTSMSELDNRLPPVIPPQPRPAPSAAAPAAAPPTEAPVASASPATAPPPPAAVPAAPPKAVAIETPTPAAEHPRATPARSAVASAPRPVPPIIRARPSVVEAADRAPWPPRKLSPIPAVAPPQPPVVTTGSLLGMAQTAAAPAPQPVPFNFHWGPNGN